MHPVDAGWMRGPGAGLGQPDRPGLAQLTLTHSQRAGQRIHCQASCLEVGCVLTVLYIYTVYVYIYIRYMFYGMMMMIGLNPVYVYGMVYI